MLYRKKNAGAGKGDVALWHNSMSNDIRIDIEAYAVGAYRAGAGRMIYRAYVLTFEGTVIRYQDFDCETDDEAVWLAQELVGDDPVEVWLGPRRITRLPPQRS